MSVFCRMGAVFLFLGVENMSQSILLLCCDSCAPKLSEGLKKDLEAQGKRVSILAPLAGCKEDACGDSFCRCEAIKLMADGKKDELLSILVDRVEAAGKDADIVIVRPIADDTLLRDAYGLNIALAKNIDACVIPAVCGKDKSDDDVAKAADLAVKMFARDGLDIRVIASGCSDSAAKRVEASGLAVVRANDPKLAADKIAASSAIVTPTKFMRSLRAKCRADKKTIVLPEGALDRILKAAAELRALDLVNLILLGDEAEIRAKAAEIGVEIDPSIKIVNPATSPDIEDYANTLYELRKAKGMELDKARKLMADKTFFGTMMVYKGVADGLVSGATTSTADTIRPALQFIKTKPGIKTVSGVFLMSLADRVYIYGDCAVIPNATTDQLRDVAIASAATAKAFGIDPKIAMLSYSTGTSGSGPDVDAVREATEKVREAAPDLAVEGPIQYDAAVVPSVAKTKLPDSPVAGKANVFVFPTLNAGNIGYKAVQRSANAIAIGPLLQGLNKPVNDLSRGATVADIVNTVIVTAIQAQG